MAADAKQASTANENDGTRSGAERERFEVFLLELDALLGRPDQDEDSYQDLLQRHPVVFRALGYQAWIPKPTLVTAVRSFQPDFLVQGVDGIWEVFELKRPDTPVLKAREPRRQFYAEFDSYISQCSEYAHFFLDSANRAQVRERYHIDVQEHVASTVVAGMRAAVDLVVAHELLNLRAGPIRLRTFDDLRLAVVNNRDLACGGRDRLSGLSIHLVVRLGDCAGRPNQIVRVIDPATNRQIAIDIDSDRMLSLSLQNADRRDCLARLSVDEWGLVGATWIYLSFDVASVGERTLASIEVNGRWFCDRTLDRVAWEFVDSCVLEIGADPKIGGVCAFDLAENVILKDTTALDERLKLRRYFLNRAATVGDYVVFRGTASMTSDRGDSGPSQSAGLDRSLRANPQSADKPIMRKPQRGG